MSAQQIEIIDHNERANQVVVITPMAMLQTAVERGADIATIERLAALAERFEAQQARRAFDEAISAAKAEIPVIFKSAKGHNDKAYADFAAIARTVDPIISKHGLSYRFRTAQTDRINVTCVVSHRDGHSEETTLGGPADTSGSKNAIQSIGSTLTYLQRYSLVQALGLAASSDDDGRAVSSDDTIGDDGAEALLAKLQAVGGNLANFLKRYRVESLSNLPVRMLERAEADIMEKAKANAAQNAGGR